MASSCENYRHGGRLQRRRLEEPLDAAREAVIRTALTARSTSKMVVCPLEMWCWGQLSAPEVQMFAHKSYNDQIKLLRSLDISDDKADASLKGLARLGT